MLEQTHLPVPALNPCLYSKQKSTLLISVKPLTQNLNWFVLPSRIDLQAKIFVICKDSFFLYRQLIDKRSALEYINLTMLVHMNQNTHTLVQSFKPRNFTVCSSSSLWLSILDDCTTNDVAITYIHIYLILSGWYRLWCDFPIVSAAFSSIRYDCFFIISF